jgi:hypothetical protein
MSETIVQRASLIGHVIEDLTYDNVRQTQFQATLVGLAQTPQYKRGGFFVFSDLPPGTYTLWIASQRFQPFEQRIVMPHPDLILEAPGSNEVFVRVSSLNATRVTFDTIRLTQPIRAGASLLGPAGFTATLAAGMDQGRVMEARIENVAGTLAAGDLVRIIRDRSIRLHFNPYTTLPVVRARVIGTVRRQNGPELTLQGVQVRLIQVNGTHVVLHDVEGVSIATVTLDGTSLILGSERDITTQTNQQGDYNLYFSAGDELTNVTVEVTRDGFQPQIIPIPINAGQRQRIDVQLIENS